MFSLDENIGHLLFFFGGGSLMKVFAIKAIITAAKIKTAITLTPIPGPSSYKEDTYRYC